MSYTHQFGKDGYFGRGEARDAGRDNIPPTHPRRIALLADCPDRTLQHEPAEVRRLVTAYRAIRERQKASTVRAPMPDSLR